MLGQVSFKDYSMTVLYISSAGAARVGVFDARLGRKSRVWVRLIRGEIGRADFFPLDACDFRAKVCDFGRNPCGFNA